MHPKHVALFVTCMVDQLMPEIGIATVNLLRRAGYTVDFPTKQTCCGQPFLNSGFRSEALRLARHTIDVLAAYDAVVLPSGSCTGMIRMHYPTLFRDTPQWQERAQALADKTYELSEFLVRVAGWQPRRSPVAPTVTYHDSCHMNRLLELRREPRALLTQAGCHLVEMPQSDRCCGFGGVFSVRMPEVSTAMTAAKLQRARETGAAIMVTSDPGCLMQLRGMVNGHTMTVQHLAVVLNELNP